MTLKLVVIGGGKMGEALVSGLLSAGWARPEEIAIVESSIARRAALSSDTGLCGAHQGLELLDPSSMTGLGAPAALIAVKPHHVEDACRLAAQLGVRRLISVAAGVTLSRLTSWSAAADGGPGPAVIRAMPNTPALIGAGAAAISASPDTSPDDVAWAREVLGAVGTVVEVPESYLAAVTGLSGSGPAYIFLVAEALVDAGVLVGLTRELSTQLATQTILGSARMLAESGQSATELRAAVTSPGGATAAGLRPLEAAALRSAFADAVVASAERSRELGG